jgi:hypothetical protein
LADSCLLPGYHQRYGLVEGRAFKDTCLFRTYWLWHREQLDNPLEPVQNENLAFEILYLLCPEQLKWPAGTKERPEGQRLVDEARLLRWGFSEYQRGVPESGIARITPDPGQRRWWSATDRGAAWP